ncbi:MAG: L-aspartate oxidase [Phycisphaeraceae bacterium]|nr:L-aspartate oxidase [Phycisphaeraceae bacterium]
MNKLFDERRYLIPFRTALLPQIFTDVLVIGGGLAGMCAAIEASSHSEVIVAYKGRLKDSNTYWAQGGIAAVVPPELGGSREDSVDLHIQDTLDAGAGLCDRSVVESVIDRSSQAVRRLVDMDMPFDRCEAGDGLALGREGGHSASRILHCDGDATGRAISERFASVLRDNDRIRVFDQCFVLDLITVEGNTPQCVGAITHHAKFGLQVIWAGAVILASGGAGQVYRESTNPRQATGDGLAMAYRAGAVVGDLEFMQFHPTTLYVAGSSRSLITEAVRGEGGVLIDHHGHRFMPDHHPLADLAPRDVVSRAILMQMERTHPGRVYLDCRAMAPGTFARRFPGIHHQLRQFEIDPETTPIPIHPAAHYMIGGVWVDAEGRTSIRGLYAAGEVACSGLHGANRLASNSLLEAMVLGRAAGETCREMKSLASVGPVRVISDVPISDRSELDLTDVRSSLRSVMWRHVGINREGERLSEIQEMFDFWGRYMLDKIFDDVSGWEVQNLLLIGALITRAAAHRDESRGTHFRTDRPEANDGDWLCHVQWRRGESSARCVGLTVTSPLDAPASKGPG